MSDITTTTTPDLEKLPPISGADFRRLMAEAFAIAGRELSSEVTRRLSKKDAQKLTRELAKSAATFQQFANKYSEPAEGRGNVVAIRPAVAARQTEQYVLWSCAAAVCRDFVREIGQ